MQLPHSLHGVVAVLEHLGAEDEVERAVADGQFFDAADELGSLVGVDVDADVLARPLGEEGVIGLGPAADVEDAIARPGFLSLFLEPGGERRADGPRGRAQPWVTPVVARPVLDLRHV